MADRSIRGNWGWTRYELVLDVPRESELVAFGVFLLGQGEVLLDNVNFEMVSPETPTTGRVGHGHSSTAGHAMWSAPSNLDFEAE